jgi:drug/metabolite transporter (DMT)-like permease
MPEGAYNAEAFYAGTATLGQWRKTVHQFNIGMMKQLQDDASASAASPRSPLSGCDSESSDRSDSDGAVSFSASPEKGCPSKTWHSGMRSWHPQLYHWCAERLGTRTKVCLIASFLLFEALKFSLAERAYVEGVNTFSILVVTNFTSLCISLSVSFLLEGVDVVDRILVCSAHWRFMGVAVLFTFASVLLLIAYHIGTPAAEVVTVGYIYLPVSVVLSYYVFRRRYGRFEWLSVGMMTLAILTFVLLREQSKGQVDRFGRRGFAMVLFAVCVSVLSSILAERIFKERSVGRNGTIGPRQDKFYVMKAHLDYSLLVVSCALWFTPSSVASMFGDFFEQWSHSPEWFGSWGRYQFLMVLVAVGQGWAAGLVTKEFSTVIKSMVQTLSVIMVMLLEDPIMGNRFHFLRREAPSIMLVVIIIMSAMIFQTGRINLRVIRKAMDLDTDRLPAPEDGQESPRRIYPTSASSEDGAVASAECDTSPASVSEVASSWRGLLATYALIVVYIISDAGRTIVIQKSLSTSVINSTSMTLAICICGLVVASCLTLYTNGCEGLRQAWDPKEILRCLPAAFLFALSTTFGNMAFALGINCSLYVVLGKFYTPVAAIGARWVMGKFYMWLEWFALVILTLATCCFGYLKEFDVTTGVPNPGSAPAMLLVLCSAGTSALASLVTEKILKVDNVPFHLKKVRLDAGSVVSSAILIPIVGMIATRPQDIPWVARPADYQQCPASSVCWQLRGDGGSQTCANDGCECDCTEGVFAGWDRWVLLLALVVNTAQGWLVGKVTQRFSTVHRAIADSFSLLGIYFVGDPIFNGSSLGNVSLNLVAFIVPLSTATFAVATSEMQKVMNAMSKLRSKRDHWLGGPKANRKAARSAPESASESDSESDVSELGARLTSISRSVSTAKSLKGHACC